MKDNKKIIEIPDRSFELSQTARYTLVFRFIPDGFCFIIFNGLENKVLYFAEITEKNKDLFILFKKNATKLPVLKKKFKKIFFIWDTTLYTLLPDSIFEKENVTKCWKLNFGELNEQTHSLFSDKLKLQNIVNIYAIPLNIVNLVTEIFPSVRFLNQQSIHIISSLFECRRENSSRVYLQIHPDFFDALLIQQGKLMLANSFRFQNTDEFLYFAINLFEQFHLNQYETTVVLSGEIGNSDPKVKALQRYLDTIVFKKLSVEILGINPEKTGNSTRYINLFNLPVCVS